MMRNDSIKRTMYNNRPVPPPTFVRSIGQALNDLPSKKKTNVLQLLATPVIVLAATAVVYVTVINQSALSFLQRPAAEGDATPEATVGEVLPGDTAEGDATTAPEATVAPTPECETVAPGTGDATPAPTLEATAEETAAATSEGTPAPTPTPGPEEPAMTAAAPDATAMPGQDGDGIVTSGTGEGKIALGNSCDYVHAVDVGTGIDYVIKGHTTDELLMYFKIYGTGGRNNTYTVGPWGHPSLIFVLIDGQVDDNFVGTTISEDKLNLLISSNDDAKPYGVYVRGMLDNTTIEFSGSGDTFVLTIHNTNPSFRPTSNFTILTRYETDDEKVHFYALPVKSR